MASGDDRAVAVRVTGRVQGVWYRGWAAREARARGLKGWVRNEADGSVRALIGGPAREVEAMVATLWEGPPAARVTGVEAQAAEMPQGPGFEVRR